MHNILEGIAFIIVCLVWLGIIIIGLIDVYRVHNENR